MLIEILSWKNFKILIKIEKHKIAVIDKLLVFTFPDKINY